MHPLRFDTLRSLLCIGAHADDIEIGCGGTLLRLLAEHPAATVHWVVLSGAGQREQEARTAAGRWLGSAARHEIIVREFRDGYFPHEGPPLKGLFHELAERLQPQLIFTHRRDDRHQDHRAVAEYTWNAFRNHAILEYEIPKYEGDLGQPNVFFPLDEATCRTKVETLCDVYASQRGKPWFTPDAFWALLRLRGLECHSPSRFAEAFYAGKLVISQR